MINCPFCGSTAEVDGEWTAMDSKALTISGWYRVGCDSCGALGPTIYFDREPNTPKLFEIQATIAWNNRKVIV